MDLYEIGKSIRDDLRDNVKDPINREGQWVHFSEISLTGKTPAIYIEKVPSSLVLEFVGENNEVEFPRFQLAIVVKIGDTGTIDDTLISNWNELLLKLSKKVTDRLKTVELTIDTTYIKWLRRLPIGGVLKLDDARRGMFLVYEVQPA